MDAILLIVISLTLPIIYLNDRKNSLKKQNKKYENAIILFGLETIKNKI
jgi:hypothetical protein